MRSIARGLMLGAVMTLAAGCGAPSAAVHHHAARRVTVLSEGAAPYQGAKNLKKWAAAAKAAPHNEEAQIQAGVSAFQNDKPQLAIQYYLKAAADNPNDATPWNNIGNVYRNLLHEDRVAMAYYRKAIKIEPLYDVAWYNLAWTEQSMGDIAAAKATAAEALKVLPPTDPDHGSFEQMLKNG
jgi:tetratricopeptide (TPR) repeat protein